MQERLETLTKILKPEEKVYFDKKFQYKPLKESHLDCLIKLCQSTNLPPGLDRFHFIDVIASTSCILSTEMLLKGKLTPLLELGMPLNGIKIITVGKQPTQVIDLLHKFYSNKNIVDFLKKNPLPKEEILLRLFSPIRLHILNSVLANEEYRNYLEHEGRFEIFCNKLWAQMDKELKNPESIVSSIANLKSFCSTNAAAPIRAASAAPIAAAASTVSPVNKQPFKEDDAEVEEEDEVESEDQEYFPGAKARRAGKRARVNEGGHSHSFYTPKGVKKDRLKELDLEIDKFVQRHQEQLDSSSKFYHKFIISTQPDLQEQKHIYFQCMQQMADLKPIRESASSENRKILLDDYLRKYKSGYDEGVIEHIQKLVDERNELVRTHSTTMKK